MPTRPTHSKSTPYNQTLRSYCRIEKLRNLRQIFEDDDKPLQSESSNLRYQPQSSQKSKLQQQLQKTKTKGNPLEVANAKPVAKDADAWTTVTAKVASGYKGSENVGRVGVALSRNGAGGVKLIVYKSGNNLLSTLLLTISTKSSKPRGGAYNVILRESYMQFYDDEQHFWSLHFLVPKDECEFIDALTKLSLPVERIQSANKSPGQVKSTDTKATVESLSEKDPLLRMKQAAAAAEKAMDTTALAICEEFGVPNNYDSGSESTQSAEDIIVMPRLNSVSKVKTIVPVITSNSTLSLAITTQSKPQTTTASSQLEMYLDEQRATGHAMEKKMDTILQAMARLAASSSVQITESGNDIPTPLTTDPEKQNDKKMGGILNAMSRLTNNSVQQFNDMLNTNQTIDNEDELLELEQKLLNFKKENRSLMKSLKAKEQALAELRASTCALCEELLLQNNELKLQNQTLISAMSSLNVKQTSSSTPPCSASACASSSSDSCSNCDEYRSKIAKLERSVSSLQSILHNYMKRDGVHNEDGSCKPTATSPDC